MKFSHLTEHATRRKQQRGISDLQLRLLELFGEDHYQKGGAFLGYVPDDTLRALRQAIDGLANVAVVKGDAEKVITVMRKNRRIETTRYAA
jgi:hypothetical protein